jgi:hypothetical protein
MTLHRPTYLIEVLDTPDATDGVVHEVSVLFGDQMRAELEASRNMIDLQSQAFAVTGLWCWAALARTGRTDHRWQDFQHLIAAVEKVTPPTADGDGLDPTRAGAPTLSP